MSQSDSKEATVQCVRRQSHVESILGCQWRQPPNDVLTCYQVWLRRCRFIWRLAVVKQTRKLQGV